MKTKDRKEYEALATPQERAKWLLRKDVVGKLMLNGKKLSLEYKATAAGATLPGDYDSEEAAVVGGTAWLSEMAGLGQGEKSPDSEPRHSPTAELCERRGGAPE